MRWRKLGQVFVPDKNREWMLSHAAVPFAERLDDDLFRIYFSSRDCRNRSSTGFVVIDLKQPEKILEISEESVLSLGDAGAFDDSGAMLSWIVENGTRRYLYYIGWNLGVTIPFRNAIGLAVSDNSKAFVKYRGPVVDRGPVDPCFVASSCVLIDKNRWRMWYLSCEGWENIERKPRHRYNLKYAESADGVNWDRKGKVCIDFKSPDEYAISRPSVLKDKEIYRMWYSYRGDAYRIGYAESCDGMNWTRKDEEAGIGVSDSGWDSEMIEYPHVFDHRGERYMLYNGNGYGRSGFGLAVLEKISPRRSHTGL